MATTKARETGGATAAEKPATAEPEASAVKPAPAKPVTLESLLNSNEQASFSETLARNEARQDALKHYVAILLDPTAPSAAADLAAIMADLKLTPAGVRADAEVVRRLLRARELYATAPALKIEKDEARVKRDAARRELERAESALRHAASGYESAASAISEISSLGVNHHPFFVADASRPGGFRLICED